MRRTRPHAPLSSAENPRIERPYGPLWHSSQHRPDFQWSSAHKRAPRRCRSADGLISRLGTVLRSHRFVMIGHERAIPPPGGSRGFDQDMAGMDAMNGEITARGVGHACSTTCGLDHAGPGPARDQLYGSASQPQPPPRVLAAVVWLNCALWQLATIPCSAAVRPAAPNTHGLVPDTRSEPPWGLPHTPATAAGGPVAPQHAQHGQHGRLSHAQARLFRGAASALTPHS